VTARTEPQSPIHAEQRTDRQTDRLLQSFCITINAVYVSFAVRLRVALYLFQLIRGRINQCSRKRVRQLKKT